MEEQNLNKDSIDNDPENSVETISVDNSPETSDETISVLNTEQEEKIVENNINQIPEMTEPEYVYSLIASAVPEKNAIRRNFSKRDFALWVLPIVAINTIRRFTSSKTEEIVKPYKEETSERYLIKGTETVYTSTKNVFQGKERMRFFGFRFMSIWVFPMAITGAFMEFLFVGPLNGTNPFG